MRTREAARVAAAALVLALAGCVTVPAAQRLLVPTEGGALALVRPCRASPERASAPLQGSALPATLRLASWNMHKGVDAGWQAELARIAAEDDIVLLQEAVLDDALRATLDTTGLSWRMAGAFVLNGRDAGVLTASRTAPVATCTVRAVEPLLGVPKAGLIARYRVEGHAATLAIANLHAINFTLSAQGAYRELLDAIRAELAMHDGPIVLAGDFNTWNDERVAVVEALARGLGLAAVPINPDVRSRFSAHAVDRIFVRGLDVTEAHAAVVTSSDHNPLFATLRVAD